jgi:hypothetical protein
MSTNNMHLRKIASIHDKATATYLDVIEFSISASETSRIELPRSVVMNDRLSFEKKLRDAGAILPKIRDDVKALLDNVAASDPPVEWGYEKRTGWTEDRKGFVLTTGFIGSSDAKILGVNRSPGSTGAKVQISSAGTSKDWRKSVATLARDSTSMMSCISAAFAAPLLAITNRQSFMINLIGQSGSGKTTATLMGASVLGIARATDLLSWNITDAGLEERLADFNDTLFPIDELGSLKERNPKNKYSRVHKLAFDIAHGRPTERHSSYERAQERQQQGWRTIALTSSEKSIADVARSAKQERDRGEARRLIDVPALFDGLDHIFDRLPGDFDNSSFQEWKRETFKKILDACEQHHGKVFRKYVRALIDEQDLKAYVEKRISFFVSKVRDDTDGDIARDVAEKFALIYAGGMLGIRHELLPWDKKELSAAIAKSYRAARAILPDDGVTLRRGISLLTAKLRELPRASKKSIGKIDFDSVDGYKKQRERTNRHFLKCDSFNSLFPSRAQRDLLVGWLIQRRRITLAAPKNSAGPLSPQAQEQFIWPDKKRRRSFEIRWPRKSQEAANGDR